MHALVKPWLATIALLVAVTFAASCGESGSDAASKATTASEITKARYIAQGDAACTRQNRKIQRAVRPYLRNTGEMSPAELAQTIVDRILVPRMGHEIRTVRAYVLPPENVEGALRVLQAMQDVVDSAERAPLVFVRSSQPFAKPERLAREFGFEVCGGL